MGSTEPDDRMRLVAKTSLGVLVVLLLAWSSGHVWLRNSPYWAGVTLYAEDARVENFRSMDRVFPARDVPAGDDVLAFGTAPRGLPETLPFEGAERSLPAFLDDTVTTG